MNRGHTKRGRVGNLTNASHWGLIADPHYRHREWSPEAELCITIITCSLEDLQHCALTNPDYKSARLFFTQPTSNWLWMRDALQEVDPDLVRRRAMSIIESRERPVDILLPTS